LPQGRDLGRHRRESPSFGRWQGFELSGDNGRQLYVPAELAHGFQTLADDTDVNYLISEPYVAAAFGIRHDDTRFAIPWPLPVSAVSDNDQHWPDFIG